MKTTIEQVADKRHFRVKSIGKTPTPGLLVCRIELRPKGEFPYVVHGETPGVSVKMTCAGRAEVELEPNAEPVAPDIRPASELTQARIEAWTWWCLFDEATDEWRVRRVVFGRPPYLMGVGTSSRCYPLRSEDPWDFAPWSAVDAAVAAKGEG